MRADKCGLVVTLLRILWLAAIVLSAATAAQASRWGKDYIPNVPVVTQDGHAVPFYDALIKDKIFILSFLFTSCRDVCPLATARLAQLQEKLGDRMGRDIFFYSISVDPERDTPDQLKKYAEAFGAGPGWLFLTGIPEDIKLLRHRLGERSLSLGEHRNDVLLGNGFTGEWQRDSALGDLDRLMMTLQALNPAWPSQVQGPAKRTTSLEGYELKGPPGEALFLKACAGCHSIGRGDRVGPDLDGITERRQRAWLTSFIADPGKMRSRKDPIAIALAAKYPTVRMPAIGVSASEAEDLIAYIEGRQSRGPRGIALEPLLALTTHQGRRLSLDDVKGRPLAVAFGFTHCPDVCPTTLLHWSNALAALGPRGDQLKVLFVSVDSQRDTPETLKAYMSSFDPRITALTGSASEIAAAAEIFDAFYEKVKGSDGSFTYDHSVKTYVLDRNMRLAGSVDIHTEDAVRNSLLAALLAR